MDTKMYSTNNDRAMKRLRLIYSLITCGQVEQAEDLLSCEEKSDYTNVGVRMYSELVYAYFDLHNEAGNQWQNAERALKRIDIIVQLARDERIKVRNPKYLLVRVLALKVLGENHPIIAERQNAYSYCLHLAKKGAEKYPEMEVFNWVQTEIKNYKG